MPVINVLPVSTTSAIKLLNTLKWLQPGIHGHWGNEFVKKPEAENLVLDSLNYTKGWVLLV